MTDTDICVYGLGYIGLPTAAILADSGHRVTGYDIDRRLLRSLRAGVVEIEERGLEALVGRALASGALTVSDRAVPADYHLICVQTPLDGETGTADLRSVKAAARAVTAQLTPGATVVLESTVPPGTTRNAVLPILESDGLRAGTDFRLAFCPETVLPGDILRELRRNSRIVGGIDEESTAAARRLYESFVEGEIHETDATTAEMAKLVQNTFRDVNIAFANEVAKIARDAGVDSGDVVRLANTHPRVNVHRPGPGVGGHCIPVDPWFLVQVSPNAALVETARRVNDSMVDYVVDLLEGEMGSFEGRTVGVLGISYKGNVTDTRESPGLRIVERLRADAGPRGVLVNDPHAKRDDLDQVSLDELFARADGVIVATDHDEYRRYVPPRLRGDGRRVVQDGSGKVVVDAKRILDPAAWRSYGYRVVQL